MLSILHRASGIILALSALLLTWWLVALAGDAFSYRVAHGFFTAWFGKLLLLIWTLCTFYHLCNGLRHLLWDVGVGFELSAAYLSGKLVLVATLGLTVLAWLR